MSNALPNQSRPSFLKRLSFALLMKPCNTEQLVALLRHAEQNNLLDSDALTMMEGVMQVSQMQVRDIMVPRSQMVVIDADQPVEQTLQVILESGHSRFPVVSACKTKILGILLAKDMLQVERARPDSITQLLRDPVFVPESKRLNVLLKEFRVRKHHLAVVVNEYGDIAGLVTIEDVLEQIVGEIEDEHDLDETEGNIRSHAEPHLYTVKALTPIEEFNDFFDSNINDERFDTIGGYLINQFGYLPKRGESKKLNDFVFTILHASNRQVRLIKVERPR